MIEERENPDEECQEVTMAHMDAVPGSPRDEAVAPPLSSLENPAQNTGPLRALRHRNFRLFWSGQLISLIGTWMQNLAQGWLIVLLVDPTAREMLHHGGVLTGAIHAPPAPGVEATANLYSGWVNFAGGLPIFLLTLLAGVVADRVNKRNLLLVTQSVLICTAFGVGLLCLSGVIQIWHVIVFAVISGIAAAFDMPTRQSFVVDLVGKEDLPSAVALNSSVFNAARALGPAVAGILLAAHVSIGMAFLGNGLLTFAAIAALLMLRLPAKKAKLGDQSRSVQGILSNMREGFRYVRTNPTVRNLVIMVGSFGTFAFSFNILIPVFVRYTLLPHATDAEQVRAFGHLETVRGIGALCGALTVAFLGSAQRQRNMLIAGSVGATSLLIVFAFARSLWLASVLMALVSYGFVLCFATSNTLMQLNVPDKLRGRVMSIYTLMFIGTGPFGSLLAGWVAKYFGATTTILLCAMVSLATVLVIVFRPGGLRDIGKVPTPASDFGT